MQHARLTTAQPVVPQAQDDDHPPPEQTEDGDASYAQPPEQLEIYEEDED